MKKRIIINADDFGLSPGVNEGIIESYLNGILTSTTLMVNQPYANHAINLYQSNRGLGLGIHLTFDKGKSCFGISSLTDADGNLCSFSELSINGKKEDFINEIEAQLLIFKKLTGSIPTHMDSHHHIHIKVPAAFEAVKFISNKYNLKYRKHDELIGEFYENNVTLQNFYSLISNKNSDIIEFMCHPAFVDEALLKTSSYNYKREDELKILVSKEVKEFIQKNYILSLIHI